jgi:hypothetical protein
VRAIDDAVGKNWIDTLTTPRQNQSSDEMIADEIQEEACARFDAWVDANDPNGELSLLEQINAYAAWWRDQGGKPKIEGE